MSFQVSKDIRRFADEDSETIGRDILRRKLHCLADKVDETIDNIIAHYGRRIAKQAGVLAETADGNVSLKKRVSDLQRRLKVAENALVVCRDGMCGECHRQHPGETCVCPNGCYEMSMAKNALAAIREEGAN